MRLHTLFDLFTVPAALLVTVHLLVATLPTRAQTTPSWTSTPFNPAAYPLAVRSPYLSCWLLSGPGLALNEDWPRFWTGSILGWAGYVRVDGKVYTFLGNPGVEGSTQANQTSATFTATQSTFTLKAGGIDLTATFLSPVEPTDLLKHSIPFSYLSLSAVSNDGASHSVQVYTDISAEWVSGDNDLIVNWSTKVEDPTTGIITHQVQLANEETFKEIGDHIQHGSAYYSIASTQGTTYQTGADTDVRAQFIQHGVLTNTTDSEFRAVQDHWPIFAYAKDLGDVGSGGVQNAAVFSVGHVRDPAIQYIVEGGGLQERGVYFWGSFASVDNVIASFHSDFTDALSRANTFDAKVKSDASSVSEHYAAIAALSIRQAFGATEITISRGANGNWNTSDVLIFMKEISSNGNMNTVDVIFPAWPLYLYTNPALGKYLLEPLFRYQATGQYPNKFSVHDLGASYPRALGHNDGNDEHMPLEECGNMIIMTLSHFHKTGDKSLMTTYWSLLDQWTQFLIEEALIPANQISTDDFAGPLVNQTNLAIKGIIGIRAMAELSCIMGDQNKTSTYMAIANDYVGRWQELATSSDGMHLTLSYGNETSWGLSYNLYADRLLSLDLFPSAVYTMQDRWYPTVKNAHGVPLDTRHTYTKSDWSIYMAAIATSTSTRDLFIDSIYDYISNGLNDAPFSDWYDTVNGKVVGFRARPVAGGHLALMKGVLPTAADGNGACGVPNSSIGNSDMLSNGDGQTTRLYEWSGIFLAILAMTISAMS
ncbi:DUF1793-domain-containing protein [Serendipita vermifera]|nr:DUF1793-domain-containing protein [Serendipita vermifera]